MGACIPNPWLSYRNGSVHTVFTTAYRLMVLDLDDPAIAAGLRITKKMFGLIKD